MRARFILAGVVAATSAVSVGAAIPCALESSQSSPRTGPDGHGRQVAVLREAGPTWCDPSTCAALCPSPKPAQSDGPEELALERIRAAFLRGEPRAAEKEMARFNAAGYPGGPVRLASEVGLAQDGVVLRPSFHGPQHVELVATGPEPCRVIVTPGTMIRSPARYQDVLVLDYRVVPVRPDRAERSGVVSACTELGDADPVGDMARGIDATTDERLQRLAVAAARTGTDREAVQLAVWAVANRIPRERLGRSRQGRIPEAARFLQRAGVETSDLPLFRGVADPRAADLRLDLTLGRG